jgi:hypothetical protein
MDDRLHKFGIQPDVYYAAGLCHDLHRPGNTHYSHNFPTVPLPLIPRRLAPLPGFRRISTLITPRVDPSSSGVNLTRASPPTTPDPSDSASTPVRILLPPPPLPLQSQPRQNSAQRPLCHQAPAHHRPIRSASPGLFLHGVSVASAFLPSVHLNSGHPTCTPTESRCHIIAQFLRVACPYPRCCCRMNEVHVAITRKKSSEPLKSSLRAKRTPSRPDPLQNCTNNVCPRGCLPQLPA